MPGRGALAPDPAASAGGDRGSLIDSAMVAIGVGTVSWVFLINPYRMDATLRPLEKATAMGYPLMDLLLIAFAVRLVMAAGARPRSGCSRSAPSRCSSPTRSTDGSY